MAGLGLAALFGIVSIGWLAHIAKKSQPAWVPGTEMQTGGGDGPPIVIVDDTIEKFRKCRERNRELIERNRRAIEVIESGGGVAAVSHVLKGEEE